MGVMDKFRSVIQTEFRQFEEVFSSILKSDNPLLNEVLDYVYAKRGKQLRPILVLLSAGLCRGITSKTIQTAASLELMHTASLMHDDVVDCRLEYLEHYENIYYFNGEIITEM